MRVLSAEIHLSTNSNHFQSRKETVYALDENRQVANKTREVIVEEQKKTASVHSKTQMDYSVDIRQNNNSWESVQKTLETERGGDFDDDLEKNLYMASIFEWAAGSIDKLIEHFESQKQPHGSTQERISAIGGDTPANDSEIALLDPKNVDISSADLRISIYKELALSYRLKAESLRPATLRATDNRIRKIKSHEIENTQVRAGGIVHTTDGQSIEFSLTVAMRRENRETQTEAFRLVDPIVINFSGTSAKLKSEKLSFDLDGDGELEEISRLREGSGFLALDFNQDGEVNSGRELFGPITGNGFQELSLYDNDKNGWIDENDIIYDKLMIWIQNDTEKGILEKLSKTGIGAIHIGAVDSEFLLEDSNGRVAGKVVATSVALTDEGEVKTIQQVDLMV